MAWRRAAFVALALVVLASACRGSSEIRPAFTKETPVPRNELGGTILFTSKVDQENALLSVTPGEERSDRVSARGSDERAPAVSPDGDRIAFAVIDGPRSGIYTRAGGERRPVVVEPGFFDHPTWSPDGTRIAYAYSDGPGTDWDVYVVSTDGGEPRRLTETGSTDWYPAWSPTGDGIAYTSDADGDNAIWLLDPDDGARRKLVDSDGQDREPAWSPDGDTIVFSSDRELERWQLFVYDVDAGTDRLLIRTTSMDRFPTYSPDGRYVITSIGYLGVYRADGEKFPNGADRWKLTDELALTSAWIGGTA